MSNDSLQTYKPPSGPPDSDHQTKEWTSGTRGGGKLPPDYEWSTNPKVSQEELGANLEQHEAPKKP